MATFLFDEIIFGPVTSRRLGVSLGINLLPNDLKVCNFNCIYCECGWTDKNDLISSKLHPRKEVRDALDRKLKMMKQNGEPMDVITYAGNGEPTIHQEFSGIIDDTILLRDKYFPESKIAVLTNATMLHKQSVCDALAKIEFNILKIDSAFQETCDFLNMPLGNYNVLKTVDKIMKFESDIVIQTMFVKGSYKGKYVDNTTDREIDAWLELIKKIKPSLLMIYTIARDTPVDELEKIDAAKLGEIADKVRHLGIEVQVSA